MRIIAGEARGIFLDAGNNPAVRPTTDRIKESLFNMLGDLSGQVVVDLFAGSGALGLEALSRGASEVYFVEQDRGSCKTIESNLKKVQKAMSSKAKVRVISTDALRADKRLAELTGKIDLILADPPYADFSILAVELLKSTSLRQWAEGATMALEHVPNVPMPPENCSWNLLKRKDYKQTVFTFWS